MIPVLVGLGVAAAGAAILSDDDSSKSTENATTEKRAVSESYVENKMRKSGRKIKTVGNSQASVRQNYSTSERVIQILAEQLDMNENEISLDSTIVEDLGADSLDIVELIMAFEEEFNIEISDRQAENIRTVRDIVINIDPDSFGVTGGEKRAVSDSYMQQKFKNGSLRVKNFGNVDNSQNSVRQNSTSGNRRIKRAGNVGNSQPSARRNYSTFERVRQILAEQCDLEENEIQMSSRIIDDLGVSYHDKCMALDLIEKEFGVKFFGKKLHTVKAIVDMIDSSQVSSISRSSEATFERVKIILAEQLDLEEDEIGRFSRLVEDLGANFDDRVLIFNLLEEEFNVNFDGANIK